eukprot:jgi/Galph1/2404/GphlegSOOS_G1067.1
MSSDTSLPSSSNDEDYQAVEHSWILPAAHRLLLLVTKPLNLPEITPDELVTALCHPSTSILLAEIHAKILGFEDYRREQLVLSAENTWIPQLVKLIHEAKRVVLNHYSLIKKHGYLPSLFRLEILYLLEEVALFELDTPLAEKMRSLPPEILRVEPFGWDSKHNCYWYFEDYCRLYMEEPLPFSVAPWQPNDISTELLKRPSDEKKTSKRPRNGSAPKFNNATRRIRTRSCPELSDDEEIREIEEQHSLILQDSNHCADNYSVGRTYDMYIPCYKQDLCSLPQWHVRVKGVSELESLIQMLEVEKNSNSRHLKKRLKNELLPIWQSEGERIRREKEKREKKDWIQVSKRRSSRVLGKQLLQEEEEKTKEKQRQIIAREQRRKQKLEAERLAVLEVIEREREKEFGDFRHDATELLPKSVMEVRDIGVRHLRDRKSIPYMKMEEEEEEEETSFVPYQFIIFFDEMAVSPEYDRFQEESGITWRIIDRFALYSPKNGQMVPVEELDRQDSNMLILEGALIPWKPSEVMPAAFRCSNIQEWCIEYGPEPKIWLKSTKNVWYQLESCCKEYRNVFMSTKRKFELCSRIYLLCMTLSPIVCSYSKVLELLSYPYGEMKPYTEEEVLMEGPFILSQLLSLNEIRIIRSGFYRHLRKKCKENGSYLDSSFEENTKIVSFHDGWKSVLKQDEEEKG